MSIIFIICGVLAVFLVMALAATIQYLKPEYFLNLFFSKKIVSGPDGSTYMHRWFIIRTRPFALFVHKFVRSDYDRALHDHPWNFLVIPIWRGYIEHSATTRFKDNQDARVIGARAILNQTKRRVYPIIGTRFRRAEFAHRVELIEDRRLCPECEGNAPWHDGHMHIPGPCVLCDGKGVLSEFLPSWSLFFRFRKRRHWGFWCPTVWKPWVEGKSDHCEA